MVNRWRQDYHTLADTDLFVVAEELKRELIITPSCRDNLFAQFGSLFHLSTDHALISDVDMHGNVTESLQQDSDATNVISMSMCCVDAGDVESRYHEQKRRISSIPSPRLPSPPVAPPHPGQSEWLC